MRTDKREKRLKAPKISKFKPTNTRGKLNSSRTKDKSCCCSWCTQKRTSFCCDSINTHSCTAHSSVRRDPIPMADRVLGNSWPHAKQTNELPAVSFRTSTKSPGPKVRSYRTDQLLYGEFPLIRQSNPLANEKSNQKKRKTKKLRLLG